jgi:hypothetical protein
MPERKDLQFLAPVTTHQQEPKSEDVAEDEVEEGPEHNQPGWPLPHRAQAINPQVGTALPSFRTPQVAAEAPAGRIPSGRHADP